MSVNVFGEEILTCSDSPKTGFYRNGCCETGPDDKGVHVVCAIMDEDFLKFTRAQGNDLSTPVPAFGFPGLKPGDRWCLCALRWKEAFEAGVAPKIVLEATHEAVLKYVEMEDLLKHALKPSGL